MKKILLITLMMAIMWSCQNLDPLPSTNDYDLSDQYGEMVTKTFNATDAYFEVDYRPTTGNGTKLCLGNYEGFQAGFFIKFIGLPTDTMIIDSAYIELTSNGYFGNPTEDLSFQVYEADMEWDEHTINTLEEGHNYTPTNMIYEGQISYTTDTLKFKIPLDTTLFNKWRYDTDTNMGMYFKLNTTQSNHIREIESFENGTALQWPKIYYYINEDTVSTLDSTRIGFDASIFDYDSTDTNPDNVFNVDQTTNLLLASGITSRLHIKFDSLETIPEKSQFQAAQIEMDINDSDILTGSTENILFNANQSHSFYLRSKFFDDSVMTVDSSFTSNSSYIYYMSKSDDKIKMSSSYNEQILGQYQLQGVVNKTKETDWFYIHFIAEPSTISVLNLYGLNHPDYSDDYKPIRLTVKYFEFKNNGF